MDHFGYKTVRLFIKTDPNVIGFRDNYPNQYNLYCGLGLSAWLHVLRGDNYNSLIKRSRLLKIRVLLIYRKEFCIENIAPGPHRTNHTPDRKSRNMENARNIAIKLGRSFQKSFGL